MEENANMYELREGVCGQGGIKETERITDRVGSQRTPLFYKTACSLVTGLTTT